MDGILIIDKPEGMTSHDVVDFIRKRFTLKKVGHAGTLDPMATGVLVMLIGAYTKSSNRFLSEDKEYEAAMTLGATSDTGDAWGNILASDKTVNFDRKRIEDVFKTFVGPIEQIPPMHSAIKLKGKKLYELARRGLNVERSPRKVLIKNIDIVDINLPEISFFVACSKGTYIRQLCFDIGSALGCGAYLSRLRRIRSGNFDLNGATTIRELEKLSPEEMAKRLRVL